ncbi:MULTISPECIES: LysM peptidoglycan-binding domain-containing protein [unclassified Arcicella]|uniref:lytic transglycosylase domain-containing protein n=1 Tax=unclassified Arcicella TaxID=2644986 RepID=UPI0028665723|nr:MULTISPECIES: LysM peptidoglycan-binding domain-containing protein [unclassified Arcicella]MDR6563004.1 membrane-bound lytic murein transglycosylase D [Arcicella sp. BE51]MDR6813088.1 membrane-bound lytic murein transglycosylase D [Arcicella sp. BE140]MDR6824402.1 membrane-bound lytic murein transglycosylase D [Arcicella sp. BE139]
MTLATFRTLCIGCLLSVSTFTNAQITAGPDQQTVTADTATVTIQQIATPEPTWLIDPKMVEPRLKALEKEIPLTYNSVTHQFVEYFAYRKPSFTKTMLERNGVFFPLYEKYLKKYGLPDELKYLSLIESGLNPKVISRAGAGGLWQFMPKTARLDFGLKMDEYVDERFDPEKATEAACKYMRQLYNIFGDWHLVLAAYNTGPGNVRRAIRKCGGGQTFWAIYNCLPRETRAYVPQYIGILYMMHHADSHDIYAENIETATPHDTILVNSYIDLDKLATLSNISLEQIQKMNPQILTHILPARTRNFQLRLPKDEMAFFRENRKSILDSATKMPSSLIEKAMQTPGVVLASSTKTEDTTNTFQQTLASIPNENRTVFTRQEIVEDDMEDVVINKKPKKVTYVVKKKDNLTQIADHFDVDVYDLKHWNHLDNSTIQPGQKLTIFKESAVSSTVKYARTNTKEKENASKGKVRFHNVQDGDTLWNISQRYGGISIDKLKKLNGIKSNVVKAGMKLRVS